MRVLLTGATGFIGSHVARALVDRDHEVHALVRAGSSLDRLDDVDDALTLVHGDLRDPEIGKVIRTARPEGVIHAAWYVEPGKYLTAVKENLEILEATVRLFRDVLDVGCDRIVSVGSSFEPAAGGVMGGAQPRPLGMYSAAKAAVHEVVDDVARQGARAACGHVFYLHGPGEDERRLVPALVTALLRGQPVDVSGGDQRLDYLHVADVAAGLVTILDGGGSGSIDVCSDAPIPLADVFSAIGEATGRGELIRVGGRPYGEREVMHAGGDPRRLRRLGWEPSFGLAEGVKDTVAWWERRLGLDRA